MLPARTRAKGQVRLPAPERPWQSSRLLLSSSVILLVGVALLYFGPPGKGIRILKSADNTVPQRLKSRKTPVQARSGATVEAIRQAATQVLLAAGPGKMTTTRVAERAGVSVGTLYQYFPNKEALLYAVLRHHFEEVASAIEGIGSSDGKRRIDEVADEIADAYVSVKMGCPEITALLYQIAGMIDQSRLSADIYTRLEAAVVDVIVNSSDTSFADPQRVAFTLLAALSGLSRASFGSLTSRPDILDRFPEDARLLSRGYLHAAWPH